MYLNMENVRDKYWYSKYEIMLDLCLNVKIVSVDIEMLGFILETVYGIKLGIN